MNLQNELNRILNSILGKEDYKQVSRLMLDQRDSKVNPYRSKNNFRCNIDLVITYTENKISDKKYLDLLLSLGKSCIIHGETDIAKEVLGKIISISKNKKNFLNIRGYANLKIAVIESNQANWDSAKLNIRNALTIFNQTNDIIGIAECENLLGTIEAEKGKITFAKTHFEKAYSIIKNKRNIIIKNKIEVNLGIIYNLLENYEEAEKYYRKASAAFKNAKENKRIAEIKHNLGMMYSQMGKYDKAVREFKSSLKISETENFFPIIGITYLGLADAYQLMGKMKEAASSTDSGLEMSIRINDRLTIADIYKVKAIIDKKAKKYEAAENYLLTSLRINRELSNELNTAETNYELGLLYKEMNKPTNAKSYFKLALYYYKKYDCKKEIIKISKHINE